MNTSEKERLEQAILDLHLTSKKLLRTLTLACFLSLVVIVIILMFVPDKLADAIILLTASLLFCVGVNIGLFLASTIIKRRKKEL